MFTLERNDFLREFEMGIGSVVPLGHMSINPAAARGKRYFHFQDFPARIRTERKW